MIWTKDNYNYAATNCLHTGTTCPVALRMLDNLTRAFSAASKATTPFFETTGHTQLTGCDRDCVAQYTASHDRIRIHCGVSETADIQQLDRFADAIFTAGPYGKTIGQCSERPCAVVQARAVMPNTPQARH